MKSEEQIRERISNLKKDNRVFKADGTKQPAATIFVNAPLALIQTGNETEVTALEWVLEK